MMSREQEPQGGLPRIPRAVEVLPSCGSSTPTYDTGKGLSVAQARLLLKEAAEG
ncbi:hypothetical protein [Streptomyces sp. JJ38]|uniref:hypothetical protein n=1 Tax=Streptomyces sp. JJ38 TaxID=2738128 RepID=UPI001C595B3F|nr:hypothetical protein [Streptomyces sp. JJ38]